VVGTSPSPNHSGRGVPFVPPRRPHPLFRISSLPTGVEGGNTGRKRRRYPTGKEGKPRGWIIDDPNWIKAGKFPCPICVIYYPAVPGRRGVGEASPHQKSSRRRINQRGFDGFSPLNPHGERQLLERLVSLPAFYDSWTWLSGHLSSQRLAFRRKEGTVGSYRARLPPR